MKKATIITALLSVSFVQAQTLYVNNTDGTYQAFDANGTTEISFDEGQRLVKLIMPDGMTSNFFAGKVESIAPTKEKTTELKYDLAPSVAFSSNDKDSFNEITEKIPTDELDEEYGDFVENFTPERTITITFSSSGVKTTTLPSDIKATISGAHITLNSTRGKVAYLITGTTSNGSLKIYSTKKFQIISRNANITNPSGPAINIQSGKTTYFTIVNGTTNTFCDGTTYKTVANEDQKGTIFSEGQIIFDGSVQGTGKLNVSSLGGHAICSDDYIRVRSGNINITKAAKDGFRAKEKFIIGRTKALSPTITINATSNGIECTEGPVTIEAGNLSITSGGEGIKAVYETTTPDPLVIPDATIKGGYIVINTTGEKSSAIQTTRNYTQTGGIIQATVNGNGSKIINCDGEVSFTGGKITGISKGTLSSDLTSAGGIKCNGMINITDGTIAIDCKGKGAKAINCNSDVVVNSGNITLLANAENYTEIADDKKSRAITTGNITINGGTVIASAYDNALAATGTITINGGKINAYSASSNALSTIATQTGGWLLTKDAE